MDNEIGIVKNIGDKEVYIEFLRSSACGSCGACMVAEDTSKMLIKLPYKAKVEIGDSVYIDVEKNFYLMSSVLLYILPLVVLIVAVFAGDTLFRGENNQIYAAVTAVVLSFGTYFGLRIFGKKFAKMKKKNMSYFKV